MPMSLSVSVCLERVPEEAMTGLAAVSAEVEEAGAEHPQGCLTVAEAAV